MMYQASTLVAATLALLIGLSACASAPTNTPPSQSPAMIVKPDAVSRAALQTAVNQALGSSILLADDALTDKSLLLVEPVRLRDPKGLPAQGRETRMPEQFRLYKIGEQCVLVHERTGQRFTLNNTRCVAESAK